MTEIKVEKKDGRLEDFDRNKISSGITKAGVSVEEAENITGQIEAWLPGVTVGGVVKSSDIRTKVLELLQAVNPEAVAKFRAYKKIA